MAEPTDLDQEALDEQLVKLRLLSPMALGQVSVELTMTAATLPEPGSERAQALIALARIAYVVAHEGEHEGDG